MMGLAYVELYYLLQVLVIVNERLAFLFTEFEPVIHSLKYLNTFWRLLIFSAFYERAVKICISKI